MAAKTSCVFSSSISNDGSRDGDRSRLIETLGQSAIYPRVMCNARISVSTKVGGQHAEVARSSTSMQSRGTGGI